MSAILIALGASGLLALLVVAMVSESKRRARIEATRRQLAAELKMTYAPASWSRGPSLEGAIGGLRVSVMWGTHVVSTGKTTTSHPYTTYAIAGLPSSLSAKADGGLGARLKKAVLGGDVEIGDPSFDRAVQLHGDRTDLGVFFDPIVRSGGQRAIEMGAVLEDGELRLRSGGHDDPEVVRGRIGALLTAFALPLQRVRAGLPEVLEQSIARGSENQSLALSILVDHFRDAPATRRAAELVDGAGEPELRMYAAIGLGDHARLLKLVGNGQLSPEVRARALAALIRAKVTLDPELEPALIGLLESGSPGAQEAAAVALGRFGTVAAVEALKERTKGLLADGRVKEAAKQAIATIQGRAEGAEPGQLSLADGGGELSIASGGELSRSSED